MNVITHTNTVWKGSSPLDRLSSHFATTFCTPHVSLCALTILLLALIGYTFYNNNDHKEAVQFLQDEKEQIIGNLTAMEDKYDIAIAQNTSLSDSLSIEKEKIGLFLLHVC